MIPTPLFISTKRFDGRARLLQVAKNASAAAEGLCTWVRAMKFYHEASKIVKPKLEALAIAEGQMDAANKVRRQRDSLPHCWCCNSFDLSDSIERQDNSCMGAVEWEGTELVCSSAMATEQPLMTLAHSSIVEMDRPRKKLENSGNSIGTQPPFWFTASSRFLIRSLYLRQTS